jgi:mono/diheme cytochrome c family protein
MSNTVEAFIVTMVRLCRTLTQPAKILQSMLICVRSYFLICSNLRKSSCRLSRSGVSHAARQTARNHYGRDSFMGMFRQPMPCFLGTARSAADSRLQSGWMLLLFSLLLTACSGEDPSARSGAAKSKSDTVASRWYTPDNVSRGTVIFAQYCADCHGKVGQGSFTWRQQGADGKFPPPPVNGTGHAWHHPIRALGSQIKFGAPGGSGTMPGFAQALSDEDVIDVISWFQDKWSDEIYSAWLVREQQSRANTQ